MLNNSSLLTPKEVAKLLQISPRSVYDHAGRLGGFYPAGIKCLRFRREAINDIMEGQKTRGVEVQLPVSQKGSQRGRVQSQITGSASRGRPQKARKRVSDDPGRHGL
jgi:predicted site-specific integrase-resolvase